LDYQRWKLWVTVRRLFSSNTTCLPELYEDAALYFDPNNAKDIAAKVDKVLGDKKLRKALAKKGRQQVKKYSWHQMAEKTLVIYKELLDETINA
jgi:glycosyltransferase involved in cell wall biosynthesis